MTPEKMEIVFKSILNFCEATDNHPEDFILALRELGYLSEEDANTLYKELHK